MADTVISVLVGNLGKLLVTEKGKLIREALNEVDKVSEQVKELKAFLGNPGIERQEGFRVFAMEVREVVYAAEDLCDSFLILELQARLKPIILYINSPPKHLEPRLILAKQLISCRKTKLTPMLNRVDHITQFHMPNTLHRYPQQQSIKLLNQVPPIIPNRIVGFEDQAEPLIKTLMEERNGLDVLSITGMPGIGKTTLAWKIYHDEKIEQEFPNRIWVNLPQQLDKNDLYLHILKQFTIQDDQYNGHGLLPRLRELLRNIKFLLVLENVWTVYAWDIIKDFLPMENKNGKVLITSQNENVCMLACSETGKRKPHKLRLLDEQESWMLLQLQVFGMPYCCPDWLQDIGKKVAENCQGLPLAIQKIGSNLVVATSTEKAKELTLHWWEKVGKNVSMYVSQDKQQGAPSILELSYNILPQELRDCFLYLGVCPEDYPIPFQRLAYLWFAEGFMGNIMSAGQSLEDAANEVLEQLICSNLVTPVQLYYNGKVKTCRVHRVIHGFCKSKALEQNLFQEIKMSEEKDFDPPVSLAPNYRRLCIHSNLLEYLSRKPNGPGVRSFLCFQEGKDVVVETKHTSSIHKSFKFLKVFESKSFKFSEFPINLTKLMNLQYISLRCDHLDALPETISDLLNLHTLIVETRSPELEIKGNIWRMIRLRHLITKAAITLPKQGKGKGGNELHTLTRLSPKYCNKNMFRKACNLRKLGIRGKVATLFTSDHLGKLDHLQNLKLENEPSLDGFNHLRQGCFPPRLSSLTLSDTFLDWDSMMILGRMVDLRVLKLKNNACKGLSWRVNDEHGAFRCLEFLFIGSADLVSWEVSPHCFRSLRYLVIKDCLQLARIPLSLEGSLEKLELQNVSESAKNSAREIENVRIQRQEEGRGLHKLELSILDR